jgi:MraZ protein
MSFRGISSVNLDAKGRMALPVRYREALAELCNGQLVVTIDARARCLLLYPLPTWEVIQAQLDALPNFDELVRGLQRMVIGHATDVELDGSGRLLIPTELREFAGLTKKLKLLGQGGKIEIWSEEEWAKQFDETRAATKENLPPTLQSISL